MYFSFAYKIYLVFLFAIPVLIFLHFYGLKNIKGKSLRFANFEAIARVKGIDLYSKSVLVLILNIILISLLVFALSGLTINKEMDASTFSYVIAIDSSESMEATDLDPDRLTAAKETAKSFVRTLPQESYVGVLAFSGDANVQIDLEKDKRKIIDAIDSIVVSPMGGTDINEAVWNSMRILRKEDNKAIIILSDGQINIGDLDATIEEAMDEEVVIHTIGIGTVEGGEVRYGLSKLDEKSLKGLAYNTKGKYFNVEDNNELKETFEGFMDITKKIGSIDLSFYLIIVVIVLFLFKQYLITTNRIL